MTKAVKNQGHVTDLTGAELVVLGPVVAGTKHLYDAWKEGRPPIKPSDPLSFAVSECITQDKRHTLTVFCENLGLHGVYVEGISLSDPKGGGTTAKLIPSHGTILEEFNKGDKAPIPLPVRIPSGQKGCFEIVFPLLPADRLAKKPFGELTVRYTVLGVAEKDLKKTVEFSVRP